MPWSGRVPSNVESYTVTPARPGDLNDIKTIEISCGLSPWTIEGYRSELERPDGLILIAKTTAEPSAVGFIIGRIPRASNSEAEIYNIATVPGYRRHGVARRLMETFVRTCSEQGTSGVWLEVRASNESAIKFYISMGFDARGTRPGFYSNPVEDAELMFLSLAPEA